jgi:hypothetical protein
MNIKLSDEQKAFKKLCDNTKGIACTLTKTYMKLAGTTQTFYRAYNSDIGNGNEYEHPMFAVDSLLKKETKETKK